MKTRFVLSALAVAAIAFAGCNKIDNVIDTPESSVIPFSFTAVNADTKTTNDGVHTNWAAGDKVSLFHAVASTSSYVNDGAFTAAAAGSSVKFSGELASSLTADNYDWYAIYPYHNNISTPANTSTSGYVTIGSASSGKQHQTGNSSKAHLGGDGYPVAGKVANVAKDTKPVIPMSHLTSLLEVKVTNGTASPITITDIAFTATENIVGTFTIDFVSSPVVYTASNENYVGVTACLDVSGGSPIAVGDYATFYLAIKPFTAAAASTLRLTVKDSDGEKKEVDKVIASAFDFSAGTMNTLNITFDSPVKCQAWDLSIDETASASGTALTWTSTYVNMGVAKSGASTATNNYYPGTAGKSYTSTRMYKNSVLTISPASGATIGKVKFMATTTTYATNLKNSSWTNASAAIDPLDEKTVIVTPTDGSTSFSAKIGNTCGFTLVEADYTL